MILQRLPITFDLLGFGRCFLGRQLSTIVLHCDDVDNVIGDLV